MITDPTADPVLDAQAIEWAAERAGSAFTRTRDMSDFGYPPGPAPVTDAPIVEAAPPDVSVLSDTIEGPTRRVSLAVRSRIGAELLRFQIDPGSSTQIVSLNGAPIEAPGRLRWAEHYGMPDSAGVVLDLRMPAEQPIGLHIVEHLVRPRELLGSAPFERPGGTLVPDVNHMSDRAVFGYSVAAYADPRHAFMPGAARLAEPDGDDAPDTEPSPPTP